MASKINIINQALSKLGEPPIDSLSQDTKQARESLLVYDDKRQALLQEHKWNFAIKRAALAPLAQAPLYGFTGAFQIPTDSLRIVSIELQDDNAWEVEGQTILAQSTTAINIKYISDITDEDQMTAQFRETFSALLAWSMAEALIKTATVKDQLGQDYADKLRTARSMDGAEADSYIRPIGRGSWIDGRVTGAPGPANDRFN